MANTGFHQFGRDHLAAAWIDLFGVSPALHEIQLAQAVALGEGGYGRAAYTNKQTGETAVLNNWGATQCSHGPPCGSACFEVTDTHADGSPYQWCYHRFATPEEGARSFLGILRKIVDRSTLGFDGALSTASVDSFVRSMKEGGYFELALPKYQANVWANAQKIAQALGEPLAVQKEEGSATGDVPLSSGSGSLASSDTVPSGPPESTSPAPSRTFANDCETREAIRMYNQDGDPTNDIETYPEDD